MTANYGPPTQSSDRTFRAAVDDAQRDFARLLHEHSPTWSLDLLGMLRWTCTCPNPGPRNTAALETHILEAVRKARGPVRGPKK